MQIYNNLKNTNSIKRSCRNTFYMYNLIINLSWPEMGAKTTTDIKFCIFLFYRLINSFDVFSSLSLPNA